MDDIEILFRERHFDGFKNLFLMPTGYSTYKVLTQDMCKEDKWRFDNLIAFAYSHGFDNGKAYIQKMNRKES